ncbi:MAG: hypothetical protein M1837_006876 [Sclerophora amabilis]|nr:MAG: hypothetical protein M1837_006876 [Sclerophora amabilis]
MRWRCSFLTLVVSAAAQTCPEYLQYSQEYHAPFSAGRYNLSYQRPDLDCRTFASRGVEDTILRLKSTIEDPDLYRLFQNTFPSTLDTAIKWMGTAAGSDEELAFVVTGDMYVPLYRVWPAKWAKSTLRNAMWLRDSANQIQPYLPLVQASYTNNSIASLYRGVINLQSRYLLTSPYCNSFQPPAESGIPPAENPAAHEDAVLPDYSSDSVFECKFELDSLASFLQVSSNYYNATNDTEFFGKYNWVNAINVVLQVAENMTMSTYAPDGSVNKSPYSFTRETRAGSETLINNGNGSPVQNGTGLIRSAFRPSDDATIYQLLIPANMMFAEYLESAALIAANLNGQGDLTTRMRKLSSQLRQAITKYGVVEDGALGNIYAYEIDGFGSRNIMDDANIPSLLSAPFLGYVDKKNELYQATRGFILSRNNPYFMRGSVISSVGGPHQGPGYAWPMASIVRILTSDDDDEIVSTLKAILGSTDGLGMHQTLPFTPRMSRVVQRAFKNAKLEISGLIHESINTFNQSDWTRSW